MFQLRTKYCVTCRHRGDEVSVWGKGVRSWRRGQKSGQLCPLLLLILNILHIFFEEIPFPWEADHFHPIKWVANFVVSLSAEGNQELVGAELDVVAHHGQVQPNELDKEGIDNEFHFNVNCTADDVDDACFRKTVDQFGIEEAHEVAVEPFITTDEFVAKAEARHESALF